jgi:hypothetical protein
LNLADKKKWSRVSAGTVEQGLLDSGQLLLKNVETQMLKRSDA